MFTKRITTDIDMIMKLKNQSNRFCVKTILSTVILLLFFSVFFSCKYDPVTMIPMTPEEICTYMNEHFEGEFELVNSKSEDSGEEKSTSAYMKCSLFGERQVLTKHGYSKSKFGWGKIFLTNYNEIYYKDNVEQTYGELLEGWFGSFEYKYVNSTDAFLNDLAVYNSFADYLKSAPLICYNAVINTCDEEVKQYALEKAKAVCFDIRNKREYPVWLYLYLWDDEDFDSLTTEAVADLRYENKFYYRDESLENYSL